MRMHFAQAAALLVLASLATPLLAQSVVNPELCKELREAPAADGTKNDRYRDNMTADDAKAFAETRDMMARNGGGSAAPNAQAQAMLDLIAQMAGQDGDARGLQTQKMLYDMGARPIANRNIGLDKIGC